MTKKLDFSHIFDAAKQNFDIKNQNSCKKLTFLKYFNQYFDLKNGLF